MSFLFLAYLLWIKGFSLCAGVAPLSLPGNLVCFLLVLLFLPVNWLLEAMRWRFLLAKVQKLSLKDAFMSVLMGLTTAIMTPAQLGEFAGRLFLVNSSCRKMASLLWTFGGLMMTVALLTLGLPSVIYYVNCWLPLSLFLNGIWNYAILIGMGFLIVFVLMLIFARCNKLMFLKVKRLFFSFSLEDVLKLFLLSLLRCFVFSGQLVLMLKFYGMTESWLDMFVCVCVSYLIITFVPSFFFSDAVVRSSVAAMVFSPFVDSSLIVVSASVSLWIVNVAIPTLVGIALLFCFKRR
ncbi:MAG: hypothetical protein WCU80_04220 [Paludibacteraceae bacterium]